MPGSGREHFPGPAGGVALPAFRLSLANICCSKQWHHPPCPVLSLPQESTPPAIFLRGRGQCLTGPAVPGAGCVTFLACDGTRSCAIFNLRPGHSAPLPVNTAQMTVLESHGAAGSGQGQAVRACSVPSAAAPSGPRRTGSLGGEAFIHEPTHSRLLRTRQGPRRLSQGSGRSEKGNKQVYKRRTSGPDSVLWRQEVGWEASEWTSRVGWLSELGQAPSRLWATILAVLGQASWPLSLCLH